MSEEIKSDKDKQKTDKSLIILVGPPASGKSTWGKKFAQEKGIVYVSTDAIRAELGTGEGDQTVSAAAFVLARQRVSQTLAAGKSAMIDATSVNRKARRDWINLAKGHNAYTIAVAFEVPQAELVRRDTARERHVGPKIIGRFVKKYERPTETEVNKVILK